MIEFDNLTLGYDRRFPLRVDELVGLSLWHRVGALRSLARRDRTASPFNE